MSRTNQDELQLIAELAINRLVAEGSFSVAEFSDLLAESGVELAKEKAQLTLRAIAREGRATERDGGLFILNGGAEA